MKFFTLNANVKLMPVERGDILEDPIGEMLEKKKIGCTSGGGTLMGNDTHFEGAKTISSCDIDIEMNDTFTWEEATKELLPILETFPIPKGSALFYVTEEEEQVIIPVGTMEGLAIYVCRTLEKDILEKYTLQDISDSLWNLMGGNDKITQMEYSSNWGYEEYVGFFLYGKSYNVMLQSIQEYVNTCPALQKCIIEQIA